VTSPAYLNPTACRRRYEVARSRGAEYPTEAWRALADRLFAAANRQREGGGMGSALHDRAIDAYSRTWEPLPRMVALTWPDDIDEWQCMQARIGIGR
jgi:alkylation response protein AidB-like acyl-CoA dehydrogenase